MSLKPRPSLVRLAVALLASMLAGAALAAPEWGIDRPGGDYKNFNLPSDTPSICEQQCNAENQCKAWTFVHPGVQGPQARCWLKSTVPAQVQNNCCVSGVKQVSTGSFEVNRDRPGLDYKNFDLPAPQPHLCQATCLGEAQCRAWTYVKPGVQGPAPRCWLKSDVPVSKIDGCCVSGVK